MRRFAALLSLLLMSSPAFAADGADFSGAWKRDCDKNYGLKISRIADNAFSVAFCGPWTCGGQAWIPRTAIAGDPTFKVVSDVEIGVRRYDPDGWLMYRRCSRDPASWEREQQAARLQQAKADPEPNEKAR